MPTLQEAPDPPDRRAALAALRRRIAAATGRDGGGPEGWDGVPLAVGGDDGGGLRLHQALARGLHRIEADYPDRPSAAAFSLGLLALRGEATGGACGAVLWAFGAGAEREWGRPSGHGLARLGIDPSSVVLARARAEREVSWVLEEGVRSGAFAALVGEAVLGFVAQRRLSHLAAEAGIPLLLVAGEDGTAGGGPAAARWRVAARPSERDPLDPSAPGRRRWRVDLLRSRAGPPGAWTVEWDREAGRLRLAAGVADRADEAGPRGRLAG